MGEIEIKGFLCERCSHKWVSRENAEHVPIVCPKCKSPYWNIKRKNKKGGKK
jgi:Zn finger protein HypA/HybF involved in hydrogenase expression